MKSPAASHRTSGLALVAVDIGNSRLKFGLFEPAAGVAAAPRTLPQPERTLELPAESESFDRLLAWLAPHTPADAVWRIGSVQRAYTGLLLAWLGGRETGPTSLLTAADLPLEVRLPRPDLAGIDRLLSAVAANRLRPSTAPAIVVDLGTAITVDLISPQGAFLGGAILPGSAMSARAMHEFTDLLPLVDMPGLAEPPPAVGTATVEAMKSGLFWGAVGGVRQLIELFGRQVVGEPRVFLTGGAAPAVAVLISPGAEYAPHLTLAGIALSEPRAAPRTNRTG